MKDPLSSTLGQFLVRDSWNCLFKQLKKSHQACWDDTQVVKSTDGNRVWRHTLAFHPSTWESREEDLSFQASLGCTTGPVSEERNK